MNQHSRFSTLAWDIYICMRFIYSRHNDTQFKKANKTLQELFSSLNTIKLSDSSSTEQFWFWLILFNDSSPL